MKKILSLFLAALLCVGVGVQALAADAPRAQLYTIYQNGMLFQQKKDAVFAGTASSDDEVCCTLFNAQNEAVAFGVGRVQDGVFAVSIPAPAGSYDEYTAVLTLDGKEFAALTGIVFGELWLASGQSNMQMGLSNSLTGKKMMEQGIVGSRWLRILEVPPYPEYAGDPDRIPVSPQQDIPGAQWFCADSTQVYATSAVGYFFGSKLQKTLDIPVGVVHVSLGGSSIYTWLARESIERDEQVKADLIAQNRFITVQDWDETRRDPYVDMSANYNKKIEPLRHFRPAGMIWYQGETDIFRNCPYGAYSRAFSLMQKTDSALFGYKNGEQMPIVYTQIATYDYGKNRLQTFNTELSEIAQADSKTRAMTTIYDVPLTYTSDVGAIHPACKAPVGERMAYAACGLVYGENTPTCTAATVSQTQIRDGSVYVTLRNTGEGLAVKGNSLHGFSVCGADGIYVGAKAEIVSGDTVRIWSETVPQPVSAAYAFAQSNHAANLYATDAEGLTMPVSVFVTDKAVGKYYWQDRAFAACDYAQVWRMADGEKTGFYDIWQGKNATLSYTQDAFSGDAALRISAQGKHFSAATVFDFPVNRAVRDQFADADADYSAYGKITFAVRNDGEQDVTLDAVRFYTSRHIWFAPSVNGTGNPDAVIPADGQWHEMKLDMNSLYLFGNECALTFSRGCLTHLQNLSLQFKGEGTVCVDDFRFTPDSTQIAKARFVPSLQNADNLWETLCGLFVGLIARFA